MFSFQIADRHLGGSLSSVSPAAGSLGHQPQTIDAGKSQGRCVFGKTGAASDMPPRISVRYPYRDHSVLCGVDS